MKGRISYQRWRRITGQPAAFAQVRKRRGRLGWFPIALVALPLAAFTAVLLMPLGSEGRGGGREAAAAVPIAHAADRERAHFPICGGGRRVTCVIDGDTIWYRGAKIRIADINTPEASDPGCAAEARLAAQATRRMQELLNAGAFTLAPNPDGRSTDKYGRSLKVVTRGGQSLGDVLVREGLAEEWRGYRRGWC